MTLQKHPGAAKKILSFLLFFFIAALALCLTLEILNLNKIAFGVRIADFRIGGIDSDTAKNSLEKRFTDWQNQKITFQYKNQKFSALPEEIGISLDLNQTINNAYNFGRGKNILFGLAEQAAAITPLSNPAVSPVYSLSEENFNGFAQKKFALYENPAKNASLSYNAIKKTWKTSPSAKGIVFDREKLKADLDARTKQLDSSPINLVLIEDQPEVTEDETNQAKEQAENIVKNAPYFLVYNDKSWTIDKQTILDWLEFMSVPEQGKNNKILGATLNQQKIKNILTQIAPSINQEPVNAQLTEKDGKVSAFTLSQEGIRLDIEKTTNKITQLITQWNDSREAVIKNDNNTLAGVTPDKKIELEVAVKAPSVSTESIDTLGLTSLIGKGESNFAGSPKNRTHNIAIGTAKFNGVLIAPNEEFSFNTLLGEIGAEQGYLPELVIKDHKTIPEYGGGICQVSTTIFRAAIYAGLKITERYPHAYPVKYYSPYGFDSTIYPPHPDLCFINDTPNYILIQGKIQGTKLTFEFYGTNDGREVKIKGPTILESNPDGSMKTVLYQEIWRDGQLERKDKFSSNYKSPTLYPKEEQNPLE